MSEIKIISQERLLDKFFTVEKAEVALPDGAHIDRYFIRTRQATGILLHKTDEDKIVLVYQHRVPVMTEGENGGWIYEIPAGVFDDGEDAEQCARREALEETGYRVNDVQLIGRYFASPGHSTEQLSVFYAQVTEADKQHSGGGLADEHEMIQVVEMPVQEAFARLDANRMNDAKTMIALLWLKSQVREY